MKIVYILTAPQMAGFLRGHIYTMGASGFRPVIFTPEITPVLKVFAEEQGAKLVQVKLERPISFWEDIISFLKLSYAIFKVKPEMVVTIGPKAGLLGGMASYTMGVPCRIQTKWGIRLETTRGALRAILTIADKIAAACAQLILCDSQSGKDRTAELGLARAQKIRVVANGSANGINTEKFSITPANQEKCRAFRKELRLNDNDPLVGFVGRLNLDKGLIELIGAWEKIKSAKPEAVLAVIGADECESALEKAALARLSQMPGVKILGPRTDVESIFLAMDVFIMPSHREGFGVVVLEAAAMGVPTVGFNVTGMKDSVVNQQTGALVELGDVSGMAAATLNYLNSPALRKLHGENGRLRVHQDFKQSTVWQGYFEIFSSLANEQNENTNQLKLKLK